MRRREVLTGLVLAAGIPSARPQQLGRVYRIAVVDPSRPVAVWSETGGVPPREAFFKDLRRLGYIEGYNLKVERYSGQGRADHYVELVREVVASQPDLIFTVSSRMAGYFKEATTTIPIVALTVDPIAMGLVPSLAHPGGNLTGVSADAGLLASKLLELLREVVPKGSKFGFLAPRGVWENPYGKAFREAAEHMGIPLFGAVLESPVEQAEYRRAFSAMVQDGVNALIVGDTSENFTNSQLIVELVEKNRLPTIYPDRWFVQRGGLFSYGVDSIDLYHHAANTVDQILRGAKPSGVPFYQAARFELIINLKTAKVLGIEMPLSLLASADEVIE